MPPFDLRVHHYDPKSGKVEREDHYIMRCGPYGTSFERPPHSGIFFDGEGNRIPRPSNVPEHKPEHKPHVHHAHAPTADLHGAPTLADSGPAPTADEAVESAKREADAIAQQAKDKADAARAKNSTTKVK